VPCTQYRSGIKMVGGERGGDLWGEGEAVTEKLGARGGENKGGWVCCPKTVDTERMCSISAWWV
jgi:hypothetical protein